MAAGDNINTKTNYVEDHSSYILNVLMQKEGYVVQSTPTIRLDIQKESWQVWTDETRTVLAWPAPDMHEYWQRVTDHNTPSDEFETFRLQMVADATYAGGIDPSGTSYQQIIQEESVKYQSNYNLNLANHERAFKDWEAGGFQVGDMPLIVSDRYTKVFKDTPGDADSYIKTRDDLTLTLSYSFADSTELGKIMLLGMETEQWMSAKLTNLLEDAYIQTLKFSNFTDPDPFQDLADLIDQYNGFIPDHPAGGVKQQWEELHDVNIPARETELGLTRV